MLLLVIPALLFSQQQTIKKDTSKTVQKAVTNQVVFTNDGKLKFPDNTVQETAYPGSAQSQGNPPNLEILNNGVKFPDGTTQTTAYIPNNQPSPMPVNLNSGVYISFPLSFPVYKGPYTDYPRVFRIQVTTEGVDNELSIPVIGPANPSFTTVSVTKLEDVDGDNQDSNGPLYRRFVVTGQVIDEIHVFTAENIGGPVYISHSSKYENCYLTRYTSSSPDSGPTEAIIEFIFEKVCHSSVQVDLNTNTPLGYVSEGLDVVNKLPFPCGFEGYP